MGENFIFKNYTKKINQKTKQRLKNKIKQINKSENYKFFDSFKSNYNYSFNSKSLRKYRNFKNINVFGMGGSSLGAKAIYNFLHNKINKKFFFL